MAEDAGTLSSMGPREYIDVLRRWKWFIALAVVMVVGAALAVSLSRAETYASSARVVLETDGNNIDTVVDTQIELLASQGVRDVALERLPEATDVSGRRIGQSSVIAITAEGPDPELVAATANAYAEAYISYRRQGQVDQFFTTASELQQRIAELQAQVDGLSAEIDQQSEAIRTEFAPREGESDASARIREAEAAQRQRELDMRLGTRRNALIQQQLMLEERIRDLQLDSALTTGGVQLVAPAEVPNRPVSPNPVADGLAALGIGLLLGVALAFIFEYLDDSVAKKDDLERISGGVPILATVPAMSSWRRRSRAELVSVGAPRSPTAEAYRSLRTATTFLGLDREIRTLQVTSPASMDGKTSTVANLGVALAGAGKKTLLVDCDLRRPRLHEFFGVGNGVGLTSLVLGDATLDEAIRPVPDVNGLHVLPSGPVPPDPSELLSSKRFSHLLSSLQQDQALVVLDSPALLPVTDSTVLARLVDAVVLVVSARSSSRKEVMRAIQQLRQVNAPLVGTVLNNVESNDLDFFQYYDTRSRRQRQRDDRLRRRPPGRADGAGPSADGEGDKEPTLTP